MFKFNQLHALIGGPTTPSAARLSTWRSSHQCAIAPACPQNPGCGVLWCRDTACPPLGAPHGWVWVGVLWCWGPRASSCLLCGGGWGGGGATTPATFRLSFLVVAPALLVAARGWALLGAAPVTLEGRASPAQHRGSAPTVSASTGVRSW